MASATVDPTTTTSISPTTTPDSDRPLQLDSIPTVDLRLLSQSELYSLSLCSDSAFDPRRCDDVVIPKIDRSVFNESAGSRKQTYSRLRLAPASSSFSNTAVSSPSLHRRTSHFSLPNPPLNTQNNPEQYENSQIILLLNQLFASNDTSGSNNNDDKINDDYLVPVRVDYTESLPQSANVAPVSGKRKRGRPRKQGTAVIPPGPQLGRTDNVMKDVVVYENVEEREKELLNKNGVAVNLEALAGLDDPYEEELRRRTEGLVSEEEMLGFLMGLSGQWGTSSMKEKIVDASEFGDSLPKGWKLLLSVEKKEVRAWLSCRRYISPNGQQFVSCKEVSSYLLSIIGLQDVNQIDYAHSDKKIQVEDDITSGNDVLQAADISFQDYNKIENLIYQLSSPLSSVSGCHENQETLNSGDPLEVQVGEPFKCQKCPITFDEKDELLHHQLSCHQRKRSKIGTSITDGVIIKGGKYECQFCHKTFEERNRYNGHVGAHVKNNVKSADESPAVNLGKSIDAPSSGGFPQMESMMPASILAESNVVAETFDVTGSNIVDHRGNSGNKFNALALNKQELHADWKGKSLAEEDRWMQGIESMTTNNEMERAYKSTDVSKSNICSVSDAAPSNNENSKNAAFGQTMAIECSENVGQHGHNFESGLPSPFPSMQTCVAESNAIGASDSLEAVSESCLVSPNGNKEESCMGNMAVEKFVDNEPIFGFCDDRAIRNDDSVSKLKQYSCSAGSSLDPSLTVQKFTNADDVNGMLASVMAESEPKRGSESSVLAPGSEEICGVDDDRNKLSTISFGELVSRSIECENYAGSDKDEASVQEGKHVERSSIFPSKTKGEQVNESYRSEVSACIVKVPRQKEGFESSSLSLSGYQQNYDVEDYVNRGPMGKIEELKVVEVQDFLNNEFVPSGSSYSGHNADVVTSSKQELCLEVCTPGVSGNEQLFGVEDYATGVYDNTVEEHKQERSEIDLFTQFCFAETSDDVYVSNKMYTTPVNEPKHDELQNFGNHELSLAFGNFHEGLSTDIPGAQRESYSSSIPSVIEQPFSIQTSLGSANGGRVEDTRQKSGLHISTCSGGIHCFEDSINPVFGSRVWDRPQVDEVRNSGNQFMISFGSTHVQPSEDAMAGGSLKNGADNLLQNDLGSNSSPLVQSSSSFHTFDIISSKGEDGHLKVNAEFESESGFEGLRSVRTEPVEFSFLTMQNSNSLTRDSKVFSYHTGMEQGYDSSFWLGKDALMSNIAGRSPTSVCVWCKNEFHHEPIHSGTQTGAIGSLCPTCSGRFSGQLNVL